MANLTLKAEKRETTGTSKARQLREEGFVPGVLYGSNMESQTVKFERSDIDKFLQKNNIGSKVYLKIDGEEVMAILKDVQRKVLGNNVLHVDLQALTSGEKVKLHVPINFVGRDGLPKDVIVQELLHELEIQTLPKHLIDSVNVDLSGMEFGEAMKVADLDIMKNEEIEVLTDPNSTVVTLISKDSFDEEETEVSADEDAIVPVIGEEE